MTIGIKNTEGMSVTWTKGVGEKTDLPALSVHAAFFGSSFNVLDQKATLSEVARILFPDGYLCVCGITGILTIICRMKLKR